MWGRLALGTSMPPRFSAAQPAALPHLPDPAGSPPPGAPRGRHRPADKLTWASVKATPEEQLRLLELADLDAELGRIEHRRRGLPEHEELSRLTERDVQLRDSLAALEAEDGDLRRGQAKAEADVDQVRTRVDRDRQRLDAGQVSSPRELENLQSEITSLTRRQSDLEEVVLEVMERREAAEQSRLTATAERAQLAGSLAEVSARRDTALGELAEQARKAESRRSEVAAHEPADVLALYDRLRAQHAGVGAAALRRGRCEGCHLSLNTVDLNSIRAAAPDEVLRCEECRRILVRTDESGL
jgi:predicted  nucleic acid-binding Zn-ribbon protein